MKKLKNKPIRITGLVVCIIITIVNSSRAQTQSETPISGHYPGGHVGVRGGDSPEPGVGFFIFNRIYHPGNLMDSHGNSLGAVDKFSNAYILGTAWVTKFKVLGMNLGGILAVPINDVYNRPSNHNYSSTGYGIGDIAIVPLYLYGKSKYFDYQVAFGAFAASGYFSPGSDQNHGAGYWGIAYSLGGVYFLKGDRRSFNFSAVARIEQNLQQNTTNIKPGNDVVVDWGIGSPYLPLDKEKNHILDVGISGFATTQFTHETGTNAALSTDFYRCYAIGPEVNYAYRPLKLKFLLRAQQEFAARNTTQGYSYWLSVAHKFGHI